MQGIFQKENTDKALKYGIYRHLPTYEKIIRNLVSFSEKKIKGNTVTVTFKNVKSGTYYIGLHAWNRTSEDNSKTFSEWSNVRKVKMK